MELDFDYIVVGSGSAGSVVANRLSADPANRVALIEAGPSDRKWPVNLKTSLPVGNIFLIPHAKYNWRHSLTCGPSANGRVINFPRGKLFGGCSSINGGVYIRGQREDYDGWRRAGVEGWSYDELLPVFRSLENYSRGETAEHGVDGELDVEQPRSVNPLTLAFVDAAAQAGHRRNDDFAAARKDGFGRYDLNQRRGTRLSSSRAFLHPALGRRNLTVFPMTLARRVLINHGRAEAVEVTTDGERRILRAAREIILCGGAINTPQLLMLSGVGPAAHLDSVGIEVVHDLPGVGRNLQDHPTVHVAMANPSAESYAASSRTWRRLAASPFRYVLRRDGMLASNVAEAGGFVSTQGEGARPDIQMTFLVGLKSNARTVPSEHGYMVLVQLLRPKSIGSVTLASARPEDKPVIDPNFFADPEDLSIMIKGLREARRIVSQPALAAMTGEELEPGADQQTDAQLEAMLRKYVNTAYHPAGTCKMGGDSDPDAVLDSRLRVRGVAGLRVADASVMPDIISGNTSAITMVVGERAARFILEAAIKTNVAA